MKEFLKKYQLILFLSCVLVIVLFVKLFYIPENEGSEIEMVPVAEPTKSIINLREENNEIEDKEDELFLDEDFESEEEIFDINPDYPLIYLLPYEGERFIAEDYVSEKVLLVKIKGDSFEESRNELQEWLDENEGLPGENTIVWKE